MLKYKLNGRNSMCERIIFHHFWVDTLLKPNIFLLVMHQQGSGTLLRRNTERFCSDLTPYMCKRNFFHCLPVGLCLAPVATHWEMQQICGGVEVTRVYLGNTLLLGEKQKGHDQRLLVAPDWATFTKQKPHKHHLPHGENTCERAGNRVQRPERSQKAVPITNMASA